MNRGGQLLPSKIKKLRGTLRKDRDVNLIEFTKINVVPKPEAWLDNKAKKYFTNICELLIQNGLLTNGNVSLVLIMAQEFATYEKAIREIKSNGAVIKVGKGNYEQVSPWVTIRNQSQKNYREIAALFGMDPISSLKIPGEKNNAGDEFDNLLRKYETSTK